jgi:hypothetical protein
MSSARLDVCPSYIAELAPADRRGRCSLFQLGIVQGIF